MKGRLVHFAAKWLSARSFRINLGHAAGRHLSAPRSITQGMPQSGSQPPLLWLVHFNGVGSRPAALRLSEPEISEGVARTELIYADDVAGVLAHTDYGVVVRAARRNAELLIRALEAIGLCPGLRKSFYVAISPGLYIGATFRRAPYARRNVNMESDTRDLQFSRENEQLTEGGFSDVRIPPSILT